MTDDESDPTRWAERGNGPRQKRSRGDRRESRGADRNREDEDEIENQMGSSVDRAARRKHDETEIEIQYQKVDEQVTEVPRTSSRNRTLQCTEEQILDVLVPETTKQLMEVPETVSQDRIKQRTVEQIVDAPVSETVEELADVFKVSSQDRVEQTIEIPADSLDEKIIEIPVARTPEKAQQVVNTLVQHPADLFIKCLSCHIIESHLASLHMYNRSSRSDSSLKLHA